MSWIPHSAIKALLSHSNSEHVLRVIPSSELPAGFQVLLEDCMEAQLLLLHSPTSCPSHPFLSTGVALRSTTCMPISVSESTSSDHPPCLPASLHVYTSDFTVTPHNNSPLTKSNPPSSPARQDVIYPELQMMRARQVF